MKSLLCGSSLSANELRCSSWPVTGLTRQLVTRCFNPLIYGEKIEEECCLRTAKLRSLDWRTRILDVNEFTPGNTVDLKVITHLGTVNIRLRWSKARESSSNEAHPTDGVSTVYFIFSISNGYISTARQATSYSVHYSLKLVLERPQLPARAIYSRAWVLSI